MSRQARSSFLGLAALGAAVAVALAALLGRITRARSGDAPRPDTRDLTATVLLVNGLRFDTLSAGPPPGTPVLLLHGFPQFADSWAPLMRRLAAAGYRAVAFDQRGYSPGARPPQVEDYTLDRLDQDVLAIADALGAERFHLVGHDWGGLLAWRAAAAHPERLLSVAVLATPHPDAFLNALANNADQRKRSRYIAIFRAPGHLAEAALLSFHARGLRAAYGGKLTNIAVASNVDRFSADETLTAALNWYRALDMHAETSTVRVRSLYLWGDADVALGEAAALDTANYIDAPYRFERLRGRSHWLLEDSLDDVASLVAAHLAHKAP